jgi:hypothetical protein
MPDARNNLLHAFARLQHDVRCSVNIHAGNAAHLDDQSDAVMRLLGMLNNVSRITRSKLTDAY